MRKPNILIILFVGLIIISCSSDENNDSNENSQELQKLIMISDTELDSDEIQSTIELIYDNENLTSIKEIFVGIGENIWNYTYSGNQLETVNDIPVSLINDILIIEYTYEREEYIVENNKLVSLTAYFRDELDEPFQFNFKELYTYSNNNITETRFLDSNNSVTGFNTYEYDNMNNAIKGLKDINRWIFPNSSIYGISDNNVVNRKEFDEDGNLLTEFQYEYEYDNNDFPIKRQTTYIPENGTSSIDTQFFTYE